MKSVDKRFWSFVNKKYYFPILSALFLAASIIPYYFLITNFIFLMPLLFFLKDVNSSKEALKGGVLFGFILYLSIFYWLYALFKVSFVLGSLFYLLIIIFFTIPIALLVVIAYLIHSRLRIKFFLFMPFLWIIIEHLRTFGPFRFAGDHIANSMAIFPQFIQFADLIGPYGIAFWLILINSLIFEAALHFRDKSSFVKYATAAVLIIFLPASYSYYQFKTETYKTNLKISMIQPNISLMKKLKRGFEKENMNTLLSMTTKALQQSPDIIIWPETSYPFVIEHWLSKDQNLSMPDVSKLASFSKTPILLGAEYVRIKPTKDFDIYNAAFLVDSNGRVSNYYGKLYLVPFTEGIPFKEFLGIRRMGRKGLFARLGGFTSGGKFTIFHFDKHISKIDKERKKSHERNNEKLKSDKRQEGEKVEDNVKFGVLICYEGLYPELSRQFRKDGANFLVCMTNDVWFGDTWFPFWHASALRMRAIENKAYIARCANTGISCFFDPAGRMYQDTDIFTKAIITGFISTESTPTFYTRYGDIIIYIAYPIVLILIFLMLFSRRKRK